jgi:hypothetical protein
MSPQKLSNPFVLILLLTIVAWAGPIHAQQSDVDQVLAQRFQGNSTRKARVSPQGLAAKAGSAIQWRQDLEKALAESATSGKPVFWYVPTLKRTFMDRKDVIHQYMLAGPFSWPAIIALINDNFVPVKQIPDTTEAKQYGLATYKFIEPGFVVIAQGQVTQVADRLTTLHPQWLFRLMSHSLDGSPEWDSLASPSDRSVIKSAWTTFNQRQEIPAELVVPDQQRMELELLRGMQLFRSGKHTQARELWRAAASKHPEHPLAWKADMEARGIGPFVRGFEIFQPLDNKQVQAGVQSLGSAAPAGTFSNEQLWSNSAAFLLDNQREDGGFFDSDYDFGGADSLPNVHLAVTAICGWALSKANQRIEGPNRQRIEQAVRKAVKYCCNENNLNPKDRDELLWAEAYRLRFLAAVLQDKRYHGDTDVQHTINSAAKRLEDLQSGNGSWFHEYPNSFVTATALVALHEAAKAGAAIDGQRIEKGLSRLDSQRFPNGAYPYAVRRGNSGAGEPIEASAGRIPLCSYARFLWNKEEGTALANAAEIGLKYHELLAKALKYDNHTDTHAFGGFFFWYDMHARSEAIATIPDLQRRMDLSKQQLSIIHTLPELDGCFVDSHELGRCYGTAMALLSLDLVQPAVVK